MARVTKKDLLLQIAELKQTIISKDKEIAKLREQLDFYLNLQKQVGDACSNASKFIFDVSQSWNLK